MIPSRSKPLHPHDSGITRASSLNTMVARSMVGLPDRPTIVATGPFDDRAHAEHLAAAFAAVRLRCNAQLVLLGPGVQRATVKLRTAALGMGTSVLAVGDPQIQPWPYLIAAADVIVPSPATAAVALLGVLGVGRPVVAPADPEIVEVIVPASAGLVYRPGDVSGMSKALLRLLTNPVLCRGMGCRARQVAQRQQVQRMSLQRTE